MIENRVIGFIECEDNNEDTLEIKENIVFNTKVLDLKSINNEMTTHIIVDRRKAKEIGEILISWATEEL